MKRTIALAAAVTLLAGLLGACSSDDSGSSPSAGDESSPDSGGDYCTMLEGARSNLERLGPTAGDFEKIRTTFGELEAEAPEDVAGDWKTLSDAMDTLADELDKAGVTLEDLRGMQSGEVPEGVNQQDLAKIAQEVQKLSGQEFQQAAQNISTHAQEECEIQLGESPSPSAPESEGSEGGGS